MPSCITGVQVEQEAWSLPGTENSGFADSVFWNLPLEPLLRRLDPVPPQSFEHAARGNKQAGKAGGLRVEPANKEG